MRNANDDRHHATAYEWVEIALVVIVLLAAWPALLLAVVARVCIKRASHPQWLWISAACFGLVGAIFLYLRADMYLLFRVELSDVVLLFLHFNRTSVIHLLLAAWPVWVRSLLVFPLVAALMEFFSPKNLQEQLFAKERRRLVGQERKRRRAVRKARKAPDQINGQGVLGVLIEDTQR
jgi:hypothetical protein